MKLFFDRPDIQTVMLDMDGTVLDLHFDDFFWRQVIPKTYAESKRLSLEQALQKLAPEFISRRGTLDWYCLDFWSNLLEFDVAAVKRTYQDQIKFLPDAEIFLSAVRESGKRLLLVTNAHPDTMRIKFSQTGVDQYFDAIYSSHHFGFPKEHQEFWNRFREQESFDPDKTLFADDSEAVLEAAVQFGIREVVAIARPNSAANRQELPQFRNVDYLHQLMPTR